MSKWLTRAALWLSAGLILTYGLGLFSTNCYMTVTLQCFLEQKGAGGWPRWALADNWGCAVAMPASGTEPWSPENVFLARVERPAELERAKLQAVAELAAAQSHLVVCGWPRPAFWWAINGDTTVSGAFDLGGERRYAILAPSGLIVATHDFSRITGKVVPYGILWKGFVFDLVGFAVTSAVLSTVIRDASRALFRRCRLRKGLCPICRYPILAGASRCSECGSGVVRRPREPTR